MAAVPNFTWKPGDNLYVIEYTMPDGRIGYRFFGSESGFKTALKTAEEDVLRWGHLNIGNIPVSVRPLTMTTGAMLNYETQMPQMHLDGI